MDRRPPQSVLHHFTVFRWTEASGSIDWAINILHRLWASASDLCLGGFYMRLEGRRGFKRAEQLP